MKDYEITYYEHYRNKDALEAIEEYCQACEGLCNSPPQGERPCDIYQLKQYISSRMYRNIKPISKITEIVDDIGPTYPTDEFLVSLREDNYSADVDNLIEKLRLVWWNSEHGLIYNPETKILQLITYGWSGNEAIIDALLHNLHWMIYRVRCDNHFDYTFDFSSKEI